MSDIDAIVTPAPRNYPNGMTVAELKAMVRDWPETDQNGDPCEVWIGRADGLSNQVRSTAPLNLRRSYNGYDGTWAADFMLCVGETA